MPAIRALAVVLTAWILVLLAPPGPASAGGPTSVMLSVPGEGRTASLYYTDDAYEQLSALVGVSGSGSAGTADPSGDGHESGIPVTVTWLVHDVEPWRVDRIYLGGEEGPWIATQEVLGGTTPIWDAPVIWHQPSDGKELTQLLNRLGVGQTGRAAEPASATEPEPTVPASVEPAATAPTPAPSDDGSDTSAGDRAWWGLGGLAGGVLLAAGWTRARSTRLRDRADGGADGGGDGGADPHPELDPATEWISVGR